jgi:nicotinamide mononucleotide transporter
MNAAFVVLGERITVVEALGNLLVLLAVWLGTKRTVWTWPVQLVSNLLLLVMFTRAHLGGSAVRQVAFVVLSVYGWQRWYRARRAGGEQQQVLVSSRLARVAMVGAYMALTLVCVLALSVTHTSRSPLPDGYVLAGSLLATWLLAGAHIEIWPTWIAVNLVGVPLCLSAHLYVTAGVFVILTGLAVNGWRTWSRSVQSTSPKWTPASAERAAEVAR